jgi:hypothetical protein
MAVKHMSDQITDRIAVPFAGDGSGIEELTWGQRQIWTELEYTGVSLSIGGIVALPEGTSIQQPLGVLRFVMCRHQTLRTRLVLGADGVPRQHVFDSGVIHLDVIEAADRDPAAVAEEVRDDYQRRNFDYTGEWPVRMGVVTRHGQPTHAVVMYCHLALDVYGFDALAADLSTMDPVTGGPTTPVAWTAPLELAGQQREPAARRQSDTALRYWERVLRTIPPRRFTDLSDPREPRFWEGTYTSRAMRLAVRAICARDGVESGPVLLAAFAVALARLTGINPSATQVLVSNRFRPGFAGAVSPLMQHGLCAVDVADVPFREAVTRAWQASMGAYLNAYYDPIRLDELIARVGDERGLDIDISCFFNDRRRQTRRDDEAVAPCPDEIRAALPESRWTWLHQMDRRNRTLFLHVNDEADSIDMLVNADTHHLPPADIEGLPQHMEDVLVAAALDAEAMTGVSAVAVSV